MYENFRDISLLFCVIEHVEDLLEKPHFLKHSALIFPSLRDSTDHAQQSNQ